MASGKLLGGSKGVPARFISEAIHPDADTMDTTLLALGEPAPPRFFTWRKTHYEVAKLRSRWRETGADTHGGPERYAAKHWFHIDTTDGSEMKIYYDRRPGVTKRGKPRWFLFSIESTPETEK